MALQAASLVLASFSIPKEGKSSVSLKDSTMFGLSLSEPLKADFSSSALRCKVSASNALLSRLVLLPCGRQRHTCTFT
ncbi:hypothetical protein SESBI_44870 [Sesbania bispinosa]|nr:hypothetical protein SESBI_44870 [Sesbania bispinosa]